MEATTTQPRVWLGCLACYNAGTLFGGWIDATEAEHAWEEDRLAVASLASERARHVAERHEEWWCFDTEGFGDLLGECSPAEAKRVADVLARIEGGDDRLPAFIAFVRHCGTHDLDELPGQFEDVYDGRWDSLADYAENLAEDICPSSQVGQMASIWPYTCVDWQWAGNELVLGGDIWTAEADSGVFVFRAA